MFDGSNEFVGKYNLIWGWRAGIALFSVISIGRGKKKTITQGSLQLDSMYIV